MADQAFKTRDEALRAAQILCFALIMGVLIFVGVAIVVVRVTDIGGDGFDGILFGVGAVFAILMLVASGFASPFASKQKHGTESELLQSFVAMNLLQKAPIEGAAFLNVVAYILENNIWSLAIVAFLVAAMIVTFPTRTKLDQFIESNSQT